MWEPILVGFTAAKQRHLAHWRSSTGERKEAACGLQAEVVSPKRREVNSKHMWSALSNAKFMFVAALKSGI